MRPAAKTMACMVILLGTLAQHGHAQRDAARAYPRVRPPKFDSQKTGTIYFDNAFEVLIGQRPTGVDPGPVIAVNPIGGDPGAVPVSGAWSGVISASSIEDEVKSLKSQLDKTVTTPPDFAGRGHEDARRQFALLAILFAVIHEYDGTVRWKSDAELARNRFARIASNAKAGGSIQVYNEAKARHQDLADLILGSGLPQDGGGQPDATWDRVAERAPVMQLLKERFEKDLKLWTVSKSDFEENIESVLREAELVAMIADVLTQEGMPDGDDTEYADFATVLRAGARSVVESVKLNDVDMAKQGVITISRSCDDCHNNYR